MTTVGIPVDPSVLQKLELAKRACTELADAGELLELWEAYVLAQADATILMKALQKAGGDALKQKLAKLRSNTMPLVEYLRQTLPVSVPLLADAKALDLALVFIMSTPPARDAEEAAVAENKARLAKLEAESQRNAPDPVDAEKVARDKEKADRLAKLEADAARAAAALEEARQLRLKAEAENEAKEKAEAERSNRESEATKIRFKKQAEEDAARLAGEKAAAEAAQKAERDNAEALRARIRAEAEENARERAEAERLAKEKAEADRKARDRP